MAVDTAACTLSDVMRYPQVSLGTEFNTIVIRGQLKCDGTHAETRFRLSARNGRVHLNRTGGRQFSRLLAAEVCASAVVMLDTQCSEVV